VSDFFFQVSEFPTSHMHGRSVSVQEAVYVIAVVAVRFQEPP